MDGYIVQGATVLPHGGLALIEDGKGMVIALWDGELWITQAGDPRDYVLRAGASFRLGREATVLAAAQGESRITLTAPVPAHYARRGERIHAGAPRVLYERSRERGGWAAGVGHRLARFWTNSYASYFNATAAAL